MSLAFAVPAFTLWHDELWDTILDLSILLDDGTWVLVGGQAVIANALVHDRTDARIKRDPDPVGRLVTVSSALPKVKLSLAYLGFEPDGHAAGAGSPLRFRRDPDAGHPDLGPQLWTVHVVGVTELPGGDQALARRVRYQVTKGRRAPSVPVPDLLSTLVYEASRFASHTAGDPDDPFVHARDAAFLVSLIDDPLHERGRLTPIDRRALRVLDAAIGDRSHRVWESLPPQRDAFTRWRLFLAV